MDNWGVGDSELPPLLTNVRVRLLDPVAHAYSRAVPLHGRVGQPAELGESYVYLATSNLTTGQIVHPNSG